MKALIIVIIAIASMACQLENIQETSPQLAKIAGKWQLYKIGVGYPAPNSPTELTNVGNEFIEFDINNKSFSRISNGKITETTDFELKQVPAGGTSTSEAIVFNKTNTYSFLTIDPKISSLILYQATPIGAVLADGNSFYYQKAK